MKNKRILYVLLAKVINTQKKTLTSRILIRQKEKCVI